MPDTQWLLVVAGGALISLATVLFLFALWLGLHKKVWWPLAVVSTFWLFAMSIYAVTDMSHEDSSPRYRISTN